MNEDINKSINDFLYNYINIRDIGWFRASSGNLGEVGIFLEKKLGKTGGDFCIPDYDSIEIKCINNRNDIISLFSAAPYGKSPFPLKEISQQYGWPDRDFRDLKKINVISEFTKLNRFGIRYKSFISFDNFDNIVLNIIEKNELLNNDVYWDSKELIKKMKRKLAYLAVVTYHVRFKEKKKYYKYGHVDFYKLKDNFNFSLLLEKNIIKIKINYGIRKSGKYKGKYCDHGSTFFIDKKDLCYLFDKIR